jgi:hypothetical protein
VLSRSRSGLGVGEHYRRATPGQPGHDRMATQEVHPVQRLTPPQLDCPLVPQASRLVITRRGRAATAGGGLGELGQVELLTGQPQPVAAAFTDEPSTRTVLHRTVPIWTVPTRTVPARTVLSCPAQTGTELTRTVPARTVLSCPAQTGTELTRTVPTRTVPTRTVLSCPAQTGTELTRTVPARTVLSCPAQTGTELTRTVRGGAELGRPGTEKPAQRADVGLHHSGGAARRALRPDHIDDRLAVQWVTRIRRQQSEHGLLARAAQVRPPTVPPHGERSENAHAQSCGPHRKVSGLFFPRPGTPVG